MNDRLKSPAPIEAPSFRARTPRRTTRRPIVAGVLTGSLFALVEGPRAAVAAVLTSPRKDGGETEPSPTRLWLNAQGPIDQISVPNSEDGPESTLLLVRKTPAAPAGIKINSDFKPVLTELLKERQAQGKLPVEYLVAGPDLLKDLRGGLLSLRDEKEVEYNAGSFTQTTVDGALVCGWKAPPDFNNYTERMKGAIKANMAPRFVAALLELGAADIYFREGRFVRTEQEQQLVDEACVKLGGANLFVWA